MQYNSQLCIYYTYFAILESFLKINHTMYIYFENLNCQNPHLKKNLKIIVN